ncbi:MAG: tetratricopeptide repeat protein, partial [Methylomonas sp.]|nr:tetratricopeptide repeat protein [Methylomonas sp.]
MSVILFQPRKLALVISTLLSVSCAREVSQSEMARATEGFAIQDTNKLFVVDCLLPGQVRKLGTQMTYLSQRRPIRTTAADCEVRGGEYVAYDRANYASALKIWLPKAQEGDAAAQLYVGEIFEKGLGSQADYQAAAQWYEKAANQGNFQAQLNLGHLYEKGLGVPQNKETAMRWYRKSAGLDEAGLQFTPAVEAQAVTATATDSQEVAALRKEVEQSRLEAESLRQQLKNTREQALEQQDSLRRAQ